MNGQEQEAASSGTVGSGVDVPALAAAYKRLVLWFGSQLLFALLGPLAFLAPERSDLLLGIALVRLAGVLVTIVALAIYAYRTARALGSQVSVLWALAMMVPCVNAITLLVLSSMATSACRAAGIPVGLLGPRMPRAR